MWLLAKEKTKILNNNKVLPKEGPSFLSGINDFFVESESPKEGDGKTKIGKIMLFIIILSGKKSIQQNT